MVLRELLRRYLSVCNAIEYAHSKGVIHRDLKPANIMLGDFGETLVVDWGLAKRFRTPEPEAGDAPGPAGAGEGAGDSDAAPASDAAGFETSDRRALGTAHYMSPEQARGQAGAVGPASEVYSLGATLYELLTGQPPFSGSSDARRILERVAVGEFPHPRRLEPGIARPLEAICLKAMALRPGDRYPSVRALGDDVARWLADEPVSAWFEPWTTRARRWLGRHRTLAASLAGALLVATITAAALVWKAQRDELEARARVRNRVSAIIAARADSLPDLLWTTAGPDRERTLRLLESTFLDPRLEPEFRLRAALALGPVNKPVEEYLAARLADAELSLIPLICRVLERVETRPLVGPLWTRLEDEAEPPARRLRAACALGRLDPPESPALRHRWELVAHRVVADSLGAIADDPGAYAVVSTMLRPARRTLFSALAARFRDTPAGTFDPVLAERRMIAASLLDQYADLPEELATLIQDTLAGPRLDRSMARLRAQGAAGVAALVRILEQGDPLAATHPANADDEAAARRKVRVACALVELGRLDPIWPLFRLAPDPTVRTELIHALPRLPAAAARLALRAVIDRLAVEDDVSARRALVLCLGEFAPDWIAPAERRALGERLLDWYAREPDPGLHSALDCLLRRRWNEAAAVERIDRPSAGTEVPADRGWYVNSQGQTLVVIRGPVSFLEGSAPDETGRGDDESRGGRTIAHSFAIATREVTLAEYMRYVREHPDTDHDVDEPEFLRFMPTGDAPISGVNWFDAARYCNWLSAREGIPRSQWCYPTPIGPGMTLDAGLLDRTGYRLPTEAEWEYACRAGTRTARSFGRGEAWVERYCWFASNAGGRLHSVGSKLPNDLGLFDMLGNAAEWTLDRYLPLPTRAAGLFADDTLPRESVTDPHGRVLRGGSILEPAAPRSAGRDWSVPINRSPVDGFRLARTVGSRQ
jgi:formylglycine-generating enzyme required for sulfatase activity